MMLWTKGRNEKLSSFAPAGDGGLGAGCWGAATGGGGGFGSASGGSAGAGIASSAGRPAANPAEAMALGTRQQPPSQGTGRRGRPRVTSARPREWGRGLEAVRVRTGAWGGAKAPPLLGNGRLAGEVCGDS